MPEALPERDPLVSDERSKDRTIEREHIQECRTRQTAGISSSSIGSGRPSRTLREVDAERPQPADWRAEADPGRLLRVTHEIGRFDIGRSLIPPGQKRGMRPPKVFLTGV
jgi:hypothetical protein